MWSPIATASTSTYRDRRGPERFHRSEFRRRLTRAIEREMQRSRTSKPTPQIETAYMESA